MTVVEGPWPVFEKDELAAAQSVLASGKVNYWTGTECKQFESEFAEYHGVKHAVALANGTVALELAFRSLGVGAGDEVIVTPRSFFASASSISMVGALPVFADVDANSQNITVDSIRAVVTPKTRAILVVHLAGWPCDMPSIMAFAEASNLLVIEDCAQAHGARVGGKLVGNFGHVSAFSFCQDKIMTTAGEGGMLVTNDSSVWSKAWSFKDHGKDYDQVHSPNGPAGFRWLHRSIGTNWRMTEIQGAIGRIQLRKLNAWVSKRTKNAMRLRDALSAHEIFRIPLPEKEIKHAYYKFYMFVREKNLAQGWDRARILSEFEARGVPGWSGSCPEIYKEQAFANSKLPELPVAKELGETSIMLPVHPTLTDESVDQMILAISEVAGLAAG